MYPRTLTMTTAAALAAFMPSLNAVAAADEDTLQEVVVFGTRQERYSARTATIGRIEQDILTTPRSIQVIPEQVLLDQQVSSLGEALRNVAGLTEGDGFGGTLTDFLIRGFRRDSIFRNGMRLSAVTSNQPPTQNIEALEIIKGPASVLFGQIEPGGLVNINTKKPSYQQRGFAQLVFDEYGKKLGSFDLTGPVNQAETVAFRLNGSMERTDTFRDFFEIDREFISPSLRWDLSERTALVLTYEYFTDNRPVDRGFVSLPDGNGGRYIPRNIPLDRRFGERFEERDSKVHLVETQLRHSFNDDWRGSVNFLYRTEDEFDIQVRPVNVNAAGNLTRQVDATLDREVLTYSANAQLEGSFTTGPLAHRLAIGSDFRDEDIDRRFFTGQSAGGFNIFNPVYGLISSTLSGNGDPRREDGSSFGLYLQDQITLLDRLTLLLGGRYDESRGANLANGVTTVLDKKTEFTPQTGLLFQPTPSMSLYLSYSEGFNPVAQVDPTTGRTFAPETSTQYEFGAKGEFLDRRLILTGSVYDLEKDNIAELNSSGVLDLVGRVRSRGAELSATGEPVPGLNFVASYAYTDSEILGDFNTFRGNTLPGVAEHTMRLWASYEIRDGKLAGLGGGAGVDYTSDRFGDTSNAWSLGEYTVVDLSLWYYLRNAAIGLPGDSQLRFGLNIKNVLDERYFPAAGNSTRITIGQPRTIIGSVALDF
ncbi:TonB-dependent siderophore receptor [Steroidobacter sp.]|uniref:TonB-dependent siderophore receptor n=1 Tax=Steroidobacter sp. TaxID=1978227 RepID=UPI001A44891A|nr:TonB-dependent siderophore receptor [Steroidobacter sp.]MBL8264964.1 TonB-dependent siderophore receptor [Steroidobacter sp.]